MKHQWVITKFTPDAVAVSPQGFGMQGTVEEGHCSICNAPYDVLDFDNCPGPPNEVRIRKEATFENPKGIKMVNLVEKDPNDDPQPAS